LPQFGEFRNPDVEERWCRLEVPTRRRYGRATSSSGNSGNVRAIYKICPVTDWREAERAGLYRGSADDARDGFIHFSTAEQLAGTLDKHYRGKSDLLLISIDVVRLGEALRWEPSRGGDLFPHLYGDLDPKAVIAVQDLPVRADGSHAVPELIS
jgi:uncharacterized protein (DUF952 family)